MHLHIHVIPRYFGDMADPKGGVRGVIPDTEVLIPSFPQTHNDIFLNRLVIFKLSAMRPPKPLSSLRVNIYA